MGIQSLADASRDTLPACTQAPTAAVWLSEDRAAKVICRMPRLRNRDFTSTTIPHTPDVAHNSRPPRPEQINMGIEL